MLASVECGGVEPLAAAADASLSAMTPRPKMKMGSDLSALASCFQGFQLLLLRR